MIARYSADAAARNNRALCLTQLRNMPQAVEEMRQVVKILPNRALYRENLALYTAYSGDFQTAEQDVTEMQEPGLFALLALAFAQVGQGQVLPATETYEGLGKNDPEGASYTASGLADLAIYEGRFSDAERILAERRRRGCDGQGSRQGRQQVRRPCRRPASAATEGCGNRRRREGAGEQPGREDPVPGRASLCRGGRAREGADALGRPRRRAPGGAPGVRRDHRRPDGPDQWRSLVRRSRC